MIIHVANPIYDSVFKYIILQVCPVILSQNKKGT